MDRLQKENLQYHLTKRLMLVEALTAELVALGQTFRQIEAHERRMLESFKGEIDFPQEMIPAGFRELFDRELEHHLKEGDPAPGSFLASVAAPRADMTEQVKQLHHRILSGDFNEEG